MDFHNYFSWPSIIFCDTSYSFMCSLTTDFSICSAQCFLIFHSPLPLLLINYSLAAKGLTDLFSSHFCVVVILVFEPLGEWLEF